MRACLEEWLYRQIACLHTGMHAVVRPHPPTSCWTAALCAIRYAGFATCSHSSSKAFPVTTATVLVFVCTAVLFAHLSAPDLAVGGPLLQLLPELYCYCCCCCFDYARQTVVVAAVTLAYSLLVLHSAEESDSAVHTATTVTSGENERCADVVVQMFRRLHRVQKLTPLVVYESPRSAPEIIPYCYCCFDSTHMLVRMHSHGHVHNDHC